MPNAKFLIALLIILPLTACSKSPPKCSDTATTDTVKKLAVNELLRTGLPKNYENKITITLDAIRTTNSDSRTGKQECACNIIFENDGKAIEMPMTYTSEILDNKKEYYVQISEISLMHAKEKKNVQSELASLVFPGVHSIQTSIGLAYITSLSGKMPGQDDLKNMTQDADMKYFTPKLDNGVLTIKINAPNNDTMLHAVHGKELICEPIVQNGKITNWKLSGNITSVIGNF